MFFKHAMPFRLLEAVPAFADTEALDALLAQAKFEEAPAHAAGAFGFVPPHPDSPAFAYEAGGCLLVCLLTQKKVLPASVVRDAVDEAVQRIEADEFRRVGKRERRQIKDDVTFDLLARAFSRYSRTYILIDPANRWLVVETSNWNAAVAATEALRDVLGSLPIAPPSTEESPQSVLTSWLIGADVPLSVEVGDRVVLEDPQTEGGEVRVKKQNLYSDEIIGLLRAGKRVRRLAVSIDDRIDCTFDADYGIRNIKFSDVEADDFEAETALERFEADLALMGLELRRLIDAMIEFFGGDARDDLAA